MYWHIFEIDFDHNHIRHVWSFPSFGVAYANESVRRGERIGEDWKSREPRPISWILIPDSSLSHEQRLAVSSAIGPYESEEGIIHPHRDDLSSIENRRQRRGAGGRTVFQGEWSEIYGIH